MRRSKLHVIAILTIASTPCATTAQVEWGGRWRIAAAESRRESFQGRDALVLTNGVAWLDDADFRDGTIEFDLAMSADLGFRGLAFRATGDGDYEHFYLRPFVSGNPDASQYTPVHNGVSGWQIYAGPRFGLPVDVPTDRWIHVRVVVRDRRMEVAVDGEPLVFPALVRAPVSGAIGLTSSGAPARFANLIVRPNDVDAMTDAPGADAEPVPPGTIARWRVSTPFAESRLDPLNPAPPFTDLRWSTLESGPRGIADIAMLHGRSDDANTVIAAVTLRARRAATVRGRFGFSDRVQLMLNGRTLYRGGAVWRSRDYKFLGTIGLHDEVILPLRAGENELWLAVSEDFGGWGVILQLLHGGEIEVVMPATNASR
jgi:hypothetical protein